MFATRIHPTWQGLGLNYQNFIKNKVKKINTAPPVNKFVGPFKSMLVFFVL